MSVRFSGMGSGAWGEASGGLAVEGDDVAHAQGPEQFGHDDTAYGVDRINGHCEVGLADGLDIDEVHGKNLLDVAAHICCVGIYVTEFMHACEVEVFGLGDAEHFGTFGGVKEFAALVQELEGVPLYGIVRCGEDETAACVLAGDGEFGCRSGGKVDVDNIEAGAHEGAYDEVLDHRTGETCVAADRLSVREVLVVVEDMNLANAAVNLTISRGVRPSPTGPPIVPRIPDIDLISAIM